MSEKIYLFLADGFEEIEALGVVDVLKRLELQVVSVGVNGKKTQTGAHNIEVTADILFDDADFADGAAFILPGGMPGSLNLTNHAGLRKLLQTKYAENKIIAAICAAPMALSQADLLKNKTFTMYPGMTSFLANNDTPTDRGVETDGNIITGKGPGLFFDFACAIAEKFGKSAQINNLKKAMFWGEK